RRRCGRNACCNAKTRLISPVGRSAPLVEGSVCLVSITKKPVWAHKNGCEWNVTALPMLHPPRRRTHAQGASKGMAGFEGRMTAGDRKSPQTSTLPYPTRDLHRQGNLLYTARRGRAYRASGGVSALCRV